MYYLMNKDTTVAEFDISSTLFETAVLRRVIGILPIDCTEKSFAGWIEHRHVLEHRRHLKKCLLHNDIYTLSEIVNLTHAVSLNDTFWVKHVNDAVTWSDVSPYTNKFDEVIQRLAFTEIDMPDAVPTGISPEFTTEGSFAKCWTREDGNVFMYKRGTEHFSNSGNEPYSEVLAAQVFTALNAGIPYTLDDFDGKVISKCKLFTSENVGYIPQHRLIKYDQTFEERLHQYDTYPNSELFRRILVCDAITFNTDRHTGNFGCLFNTDTMEIIGTAPGFDYNLSLFPMEVDDAFADVNSFIHKYTPSQGIDFIKTAKYVLTDSIRNDLLNLRGFEYNFDGDGKFCKERAKWLSILSNEQIDHILGQKKVYMYSSPNKDSISNLYRYRIKNHMTEEDFQKDVPRLMKLFGIQHMSELEERIVELL